MMPSFQYEQMFMGQLAAFMWLLIPLAILDAVLKSWGMWRAARMGKLAWFIVLLLINSIGILPGIFLLITNEEYAKLAKGKKK